MEMQKILIFLKKILLPNITFIVATSFASIICKIKTVIGNFLWKSMQR